MQQELQLKSVRCGVSLYCIYASSFFVERSDSKVFIVCCDGNIEISHVLIKVLILANQKNCIFFVENNVSSI